jgi:hypothetical protein
LEQVLDTVGPEFGKADVEMGCGTNNMKVNRNEERIAVFKMRMENGT